MCSHAGHVISPSRSRLESSFLQVGELTLAVSRLANEKVMLEQSMEMEEEGIVNRLQRVIETVMARNKVIAPRSQKPQCFDMS